MIDRAEDFALPPGLSKQGGDAGTGAGAGAGAGAAGRMARLEAAVPLAEGGGVDEGRGGQFVHAFLPVRMAGFEYTALHHKDPFHYKQQNRRALCI